MYFFSTWHESIYYIINTGDHVTITSDYIMMCAYINNDTSNNITGVSAVAVELSSVTSESVTVTVETYKSIGIVDSDI